MILTGALAAVLAVPGLAMAQSAVADAAMAGDLAAVQNLIAQSTNVNARQGDGATALHWAAYLGNVEMAQVLIDAGADVRVANRNGSTPLWPLVLDVPIGLKVGRCMTCGGKCHPGLYS
jgi:ankyrin repeat protein